MSNKNTIHFGWTKIILFILLLFIGLCCLASDHTILATLLFLGALYLIFGQEITGPLSKKKAGSSTRNSKPEPIEEEATYDPADHGELFDCPFCGKKIPSDISFCFYCGKSLESYKLTESIRVKSLAEIDEALENIRSGGSKGTAFNDVSKIRDLTDKILRRYGEDPENREDYDRFIEYYLPKTVAAIEQYGILCTLTGLDQEQTDAKDSLKQSLGLIAGSFSNIYNRISTEGLMDISTDITALENILKLKGLTEPDFKAVKK